MSNEPGSVAGTRADLATRLALRGGQIVLDHFWNAQASRKADGTIVTNADIAVQDALWREVTAGFPGDAVYGEEGAIGQGATDAHYAWILDPVDGTENFARGVPGFAVSVGVLRDGLPFAGAVYDPISRWLFTAAAGRGAWLNDRPLRVDQTARADGTLFSIRAPLEDGVPGFVEAWLRRYRLRRVGSTALHLCYVAMGGLDFVHDHRAALWDIAGAAPVLLEAGGVLSAEDGGPLFPPTAAHYMGKPFALLAGSPWGVRQALSDISRARA